MKFNEAILVVFVVLLSSVGQVLMRAASLGAAASGAAGLRAWMSFTSVLAVIVYCSAMALWLWVLSRVPITQAFAFFGLSFVFVPLMASRFLGDPMTTQTWIGAGIIILGIVVTNWRSG
ncbi:EamA family transporter [Rubrivivax benzoatilyticus]|uniref:EamA family transporter n=1 Tax=Rubrivivax benzoatilyticus TaxID=316997 RepID=A0ABX0HVP6_9BURK|nr:EamA family transporter [Rubrivivax benzoatilyticus]EGJ11338.1 hypothetical protein RBXJA2T_13459 [Rubrivivax benzoatilyticus JA2 = ATCC BAA-35]NHK98673.1 EamA family transporter [Rubrivivax benzoatilyticus]NHL24175.1 EamA family transporter [Rubrivivax benzoatilyticus]